MVGGRGGGEQWAGRGPREPLSPGAGTEHGRLKGAGPLAARPWPPQDRGPGCRVPFPSHGPRGPGSPASDLARVHLAHDARGAPSAEETRKRQMMRKLVLLGFTLQVLICFSSAADLLKYMKMCF